MYRDEAEGLLKNLADALPETKLYNLYLARIAHLRANPHGANWNGIFSSSPPSDPDRMPELP